MDNEKIMSLIASLESTISELKSACESEENAEMDDESSETSMDSKKPYQPNDKTKKLANLISTMKK